MKNKDVLSDHSISAIESVIEANLIEYCRDYFKFIENAEIYDKKDIFYYYTRIPANVMNQVIRAQFTEENVESNVARVIEYYTQREIPFSWLVGPSSTPQNLGDVLISQGLSNTEWDYPCMAIDLRVLDQGLLQEAIQRSGISLNPVQNEKELKLWSTFFIKDGYPEIWANALYDTAAPSLDQGTNAKMVNYLATLKDEPVGVSTVVFQAGVAGLYWVGTLQKHEKKGIGTATTLAAFLNARSRGYEIGILHSTKWGYNLYSRIGFKTYFKYQNFTPSPKE
ncbi:MAG: hypothetical protein ACFFCQ_00765 [Promethearchaeota archaeon]